MLLKEIAQELELTFSTVAFRLHILRKENPQCEYFKAPYDERTRDAIAAYNTREKPNIGYDPERAGEEREKKSKTLSIDTELFKKYFFPDASNIRLRARKVQCIDGTEINANKFLYRWITAGKPDPNNSPEYGELGVRGVLCYSKDMKKVNAKKKELGIKQKQRSQPAYSYIIEHFLQARSNQSPEIQERNKQNMKEVKQMMKENNISRDQAVAEWLLENKLIDYETYWLMRDRKAEKEFLAFYKEI